jgi:iron complex outermembrane recepter protein
MTRHRISRPDAMARGSTAVRGVPFAVATILGLTSGLTAGSAVQAQQTQDAVASDAGDIEEVIVSGYRRSLEASLDIKRDAVGSVDAIVAEDIAKFPDLNLAESIQRVPGVSIARDAGEGRQVTVRGLGPQFTRVRVNGMEAMSANGGTDAAGGTNRDRSFDFNTFASELFSGITVRKTSSADIEEGSLGATVDLRSARPFDYQGFTFATSVQGSYNDIEENVDPRGALLISDRFFDGKFGALLSVAYSSRELLDEGSSTVRWQNAQNADGTINNAANGPAFARLGTGYTGPGLDALNLAYHPRIPRYDKYQHEQDRLGVTSSLQWEPADGTLLTLDGMYSKFEAKRWEQFLESPVFSANGATGIRGVTVRDAAIDENGTLVYGLFDGVDIRSEARYDELETQFTHVTLDLAQDLGEKLRVHALVGYSEANHRNPVQTTLLFDRNDIEGYSYDFRSDNRVPRITYGTTNVADPATWTLTQIRLRPQTSLNSFRTGSFELAWQATDELTFTAGPQWKKFRFKTTSLARSNGTAANQEGTIPASARAVSLASYSALTTLESLTLPAGGVGTWLVPDIEAASGLLDLGNRSIYPLGVETALNNNYVIEEEDTGAFVQAGLDTIVFDRRFRGNLGLRYVETDQSSTGLSITATGPLVRSRDRKYSDTLPSLNMSLDLTDDFIVRAAAAKVMARPNGSGQTGGLGILTPGATTNIAGANKTLNVGNPDLDPYRANAFDLAAEWYFGQGALLSAAVFYKDIKSFVQIVRQTGDFSANPLGLPDDVALLACGPTVAPATCLGGWQFNVPRNSSGGNVKGVEINYQQPFSFLPAPWSGFGAVLNYTGVRSKVDYFVTAAGTDTIEADLIQLSEDAFNATLYFENERFGVRVSAAYRGPYLTTVPARNMVVPTGDTSDRFVEGTIETLNVDFSSSWKVNDNLELTAEALNLTDEYQDQFIDAVGNRLSYYHHQGRQYMVGARFKF